MAENLRTAMNKIANQTALDKLFPRLVTTNFFQDIDRVCCTIEHELVHHIVKDEHNNIAHPELRLEIENEIKQGAFDTIVVALHNKLVENFLYSNFLMYIKQIQ